MFYSQNITRLGKPPPKAISAAYGTLSNKHILSADLRNS
jgi:hypothetical protein